MAMQTRCYHDFFSSRGYLRSSWGYLGLMWGHLGATWVYLGPFLASLWPSEGARNARPLLVIVPLTLTPEDAEYGLLRLHYAFFN